MNEIVVTIIGAIVTAVILPLIALGGKTLIEYINNKVKDEKLKAALTETAELVKKSVNAFAQTYVDGLKKEGSFDAKAQSVALNYAIGNVKELLAPEAAALVASHFGDLDKYLITAIESQIKENKSSNSVEFVTIDNPTTVTGFTE